MRIADGLTRDSPTLGCIFGPVSQKLDIDHTLVGGLITLKKAGEERLLDAAIGGRIPLGVAMDIAKTDGADTQRALLKAYEEKKLNYLSIRLVKRLMDQRRFIGKQRGNKNPQRRLTSTESLVNAYRRESHRQKLLIKKAKLCGGVGARHTQRPTVKPG